MVGADGSVLGTCVLEGPGPPNLAAVDHVARLQLLAGRLGGSIALDATTPALAELLDLAGLSVEVRGQAENWEERGRIQEHVEPGDPSPRDLEDL